MSFSSSDLEKFSIISLAHHWMLCSEWVPSEWESKEQSNWNQVYYLWITVMFYQLFGLSFWRHPFTAEHPLVSKWFKCYISPNLIMKQTHLYLGWPEGAYIFSKCSFLGEILRLHSATCFQFLVFAQSFRETPHCHIRIVNIGIVYLLSVVKWCSTFFMNCSHLQLFEQLKDFTMN